MIFLPSKFLALKSERKARRPLGVERRGRFCSSAFAERAKPSPCSTSKTVPAVPPLFHRPLCKAWRRWYNTQDIDRQRTRERGRRDLKGEEAMRRKNRRGAPRAVWLLLLAAAILMTAVTAAGEGALRGYSKEDGYVYVRLGRYPQTAEGGIEPILWRVLTTDEEKAYLLSEYILFARALHNDRNEYQKFKGDFAQTELCQYLNTTFTEAAFTEKELGMLLPCENFGKVFLITRDDMKNKAIGLGSTVTGSENPKKIQENPGVRAWGTAWAIENNGYDPAEYPDPKAKVRNSTDTANITLGEKRLYVFQAKYGACSPYWGRSPSTSHKNQAVCTKDGGQIGRIEVGRDNEGVRPAVYLAEGSYRIISGAGTKDDPYEIEPAGAGE